MNPRRAKLPATKRRRTTGPARVRRPFSSRPRRTGPTGPDDPWPEKAPRSGYGKRVASSRGVSVPAVDRIVASQPWDMLVPLLERAGANPRVALPALRAHAHHLVTWNRSISNLISRNDEARIVARHLVESLAPARWLKEGGGSNWMDFGSGAGFPALALAIAGVGSRWMLVESRRPKTLFIRKTIDIIGLHNIEVVNSRLETLDPETPPFDCLTARAAERLPATLKLARQRVRQGGSAYLWKGSGWKTEVGAGATADWKTHWSLEGVMEIPGTPIVVVRFIRTSAA
jgi:16S rRNA (guanine(527)-N(7))-methyltransferase RsmG